MTNIPVHVSLIMDGNGRWAKERGKERVYGHFEGVGSVRACVEASVEYGVKYLSLYAFSEYSATASANVISSLFNLVRTLSAVDLSAQITKDKSYFVNFAICLVLIKPIPYKWNLSLILA